MGAGSQEASRRDRKAECRPLVELSEDRVAVPDVEIDHVIAITVLLVDQLYKIRLQALTVVDLIILIICIFLFLDLRAHLY